MRKPLLRAIAAALCVAGLAAAGLVGSAPATASTVLAPIPKVVGNHLVNERTNQVWVPHGVNYPGFEYACNEGWGYSQGTETQAAADAMVAWHIDTVRLPLNENCWLGTDPVTSTERDYGTPAGYKAAVKAWVDMLNADGIVVILDLHFTAPDGRSASGQYPMADADHSPTFWTSVATAYKDDPSVMFDAFNEPYSIYNSHGTKVYDLTWECWESGGPTCDAPDVDISQQVDGNGTYQIAGMQQLVTAIRAGNATQPIMLGGIDYSNNLTGWLAHEPTDPQNQLVASWHNYPGQACDKVACWNSQIAPVAAHVPVIAGEFGDDPGTDFMTPFMNWADANGIGYLPWAWWHLSTADGDDPSSLVYSMYTGSNFTPEAPEGTAYYSHLQSLPILPSLPPAPPNLTNIGGGLQIGTPPPLGSRRTTIPLPARDGPGGSSSESTSVAIPASTETAESRELATLLAGAPKVSDAQFCSYG